MTTHSTRATRTAIPCTLPGARAWRFTIGDTDSQYVPYFYNPALDHDATRLLVATRTGDDEQLAVLDLRTDELTRLTNATGTGQHWSPYIRTNVSGIRPHFFAWAQPGFRHALYWQDNDLRQVDTASGEDERLFTLRPDVVPSVLHCSANGWVAVGYLPRALQQRLQAGASVVDLEAELRTGCGLCVFDLTTRRLVLDISTPFWPNHVAAAPDHRRILCCHEGAWSEQRMYLIDIDSHRLTPLRPQASGERIGHEFWIDATTVGYHGDTDGHGLFGMIDVETGIARERHIAHTGATGGHYGHYHVSPDRQLIVTDGEVSADQLSIASLTGDTLDFTPVVTHDWSRGADQRFHPHPNWHHSGRYVTFTGCTTDATGAVRSHVCLLDLGP